ncbi:MAG: VanZ family protein, partial [Candidatus Hodarchaeota archaeon]
SGMIIGAIITTVGLVKVLFPDSLLLLRLLAGIYVTGIFYLGLKPNGFNHTQYRILMDSSNFCWYDAAINTVGFIPLGYFLMLSSGNRQKEQGTNLIKRAIIVAGVGVLISLFLEISQYYLIPGRESSLFDWISNTFGTLLGIAVYLVLNTKPVAK